MIPMLDLKHSYDILYLLNDITARRFEVLYGHKIININMCPFPYGGTIKILQKISIMSH